ncbi:hypothetical protein PTSG_08112 [Salpingoeca rosetta]|uniref:Large ribosomal subunit protein uL15/eL18 domain-containing protein n=1 Tax=Salpingoeca rosetta (strain ATCC 50818 / BSB-021) TaxID=946362 RepID=F2UI11_SALR5|nr:uncharacterized protein PTSG_08112 [Salpingoeca rosetta]EGD76760.1 hypothetical protein PTSG_08112 [Salpingoeca rosetta]|eukprot:XP_004991132.1 hypothetical protein PTSG_08112 [Salpingoeca rosetta]
MSGARFGLHNLQKAAGATKQAIRAGRGRSSRRGKTAGKGHKGAGQHASGRARLLFAGGQTPFYRTQPKHGFHNPHSKEYDTVNLDDISRVLKAGRLDPSQTITMKHLMDAGVVGRQVKHGVKLLGRGKERFSDPISIEVSRASKSAIGAIEEAGGSITTVYFNQRTLLAHLKPHRVSRPQAQARPRGADLEYYSNPDNRGYLAKQKQKEQSMEEVD